MLHRRRWWDVANFHISSDLEGHFSEPWSKTHFTFALFIRPLVDNRMSSRQRRCILNAQKHFIRCETNYWDVTAQILRLTNSPHCVHLRTWFSFGPVQSDIILHFEGENRIPNIITIAFRRSRKSANLDLYFVAKRRPHIPNQIDCCLGTCQRQYSHMRIGLSPWTLHRKKIKVEGEIGNFSLTLKLGISYPILELSY